MRCPARLVISDWDMPEMNGIELCRRLRADESAGYIYIILLTSHDGTQKIVEGMSAGADDFISKPFDPPELLVRVRAGERVLSLETRDVAIFALAKLAESRDPETGAHLERVRSYSQVLARQLSTHPKFARIIDEKYIHLIYLTSPLHDIGKVGIPDSVLLKPGRLSDHEFEIMKQHAALGADTLDAALQQFPEAKFLKMARDIAASHHERFDGSGYPAGLKANDIPLCGRIVALADVYDALTSGAAAIRTPSLITPLGASFSKSRAVTSTPTSSMPSCRPKTSSWPSARSTPRRSLNWRPAPHPALADLLQQAFEHSALH